MIAILHSESYLYVETIKINAGLWQLISARL